MFTSVVDEKFRNLILPTRDESFIINSNLFARLTRGCVYFGQELCLSTR